METKQFTDKPADPLALVRMPGYPAHHVRGT